MDEATIRDVEAAKRGEQAAYARLVERHQRLVASITLAITADVAASEDAAQEAFLEGWRDLAKLDNLASFGPWICQIARHRAYDLVRARKKASGDDALEVAADPDPGALEAMIGEEQESFIAAALRQLPEEAREAMILYYREGQSIAEVAKALDVSEDVVKKRLSRARERIRGKVEAAFGAALIATIPASDFAKEIFSSSAGSIAAEGAGAAAKSAWGPLKALDLAARTAVGAAVAVGVVVGTQVMPMKTTKVVGVVPPPSVRGSIVGAKNVAGSVTLDCGGTPRTLTITNGKFSADNLASGRCNVTFSLTGAPNPAPTAIKFAAGTQNQITVKVAGPHYYDMFSGGEVPGRDKTTIQVSTPEQSVLPDEPMVPNAVKTSNDGHQSGGDAP